MRTRNEVAAERAERLNGSEKKLYETFMRLRMGPAAALAAATGRDAILSSSDPVEVLAESFEALGASPKMARVAAVGRRSTEREVREALAGDQSHQALEGEPRRIRAAQNGSRRYLDLLEQGHSFSEINSIMDRDGS